MLATESHHKQQLRPTGGAHATGASHAARRPERSSQPRDDALAVFAHDLRGPLANLALLVEALGDDSQRRQPSRVAERIARAERIIERMDGMLTAALERTRRQGDVLTCRFEAVDITDLVETVVTLNRPLAESRNVILQCYLAEPLAMQGDKHLIMQAVDNLLGNAITFTRPGGRVLCEAAPAADGDVLVRICDQGPGLEPQDIARAFRPFTKLSTPPPAPRKSTGLGLSIVRRIAEVHGGSVRAESEGRGRGATFTLRLPSSQ